MKVTWLIVFCAVAMVTDAGHKAADSLRAFGAQSKRTKERTNLFQRRTKDKLSGLLSSKLMRELDDMDMFKRAEEDFACSINLDCDTNTQVVDDLEFPTLDGSCNNQADGTLGMAGIQHRRLLDNAYENGEWRERTNSVTGTNKDKIALPSARSISEAVHAQDGEKADNDQDITLALFYFMQFLSHDIVKTPDGTVSTEKDCCGGDDGAFCLQLYANENDTYFEDGYCMDARRSSTVFDCDDTSGFQNQVNDITAFIDASMVYGSSEDEMNNLRTGIGGFLKTSTANFPPEAADADDQVCTNVEDPDLCFETGDARADVHPGLTTFHTVFVREHNRIATYLGEVNTHWGDDRLFFEARKIVAAELQHITLKEMLPVVLDSTWLADYGLESTYSYDSSVDPSVIQAFSIAFRFHYLMPSKLHFAGLVGDDYANTNMFETESVYTNPGYLLMDHYSAVDKIGLGLMVNKCPYVNAQMEDSARNLLFQNGSDSFDLAALNIERGREWGMPAYLEYRYLCEVSGTVTEWDELLTTHSQDDIDKLKSVYADPADIDLWTGLATEIPDGTSISGPTQSCLLAMQFANLRDGDRFWYETTDTDVGFTTSQLTEIQSHVNLAKIMCDNLNIAEMRSSAFDASSAWTTCSDLVGPDLSAWTE